MARSLIKPVQYYGGKGGMVKFLLPLFPKKYDVFVDAFGGSGSLLLAEEREKTIEIYNDLGENIYSLYKVKLWHRGMKNRYAIIKKHNEFKHGKRKFPVPFSLNMIFKYI